MNIPAPVEGRISLSRSYRNLSEREIRAKLEAPLSDAERVTAKAELMRRGAGEEAGDTALATGFAATSSLDIGVVESQSTDIEQPQPARSPSRLWAVVLALLAVVAGALTWAVHARLIRL